MLCCEFFGCQSDQFAVTVGLSLYLTCIYIYWENIIMCYECLATKVAHLYVTGDGSLKIACVDFPYIIIIAHCALYVFTKVIHT